MEEILRLSQVDVSYRTRGEEKRAVKDISFTVNRGEVFGFLGPNVAGKTTPIKAMLDLLPLPR